MSDIKTTVQKFTVPTWSLGYLANDNREGLTSGELKSIMWFCAREMVLDLGDVSEPYPSGRNDVDGVAGECVTVSCTCLV